MYASIIQDLPQELQMPMLKLVEAVQKDMRDQLAVRREDLDALRATIHELAEAQKRTEERLDRLEAVVAELAEAQKHTERQIAELVEVQKRTEKRLVRLEIRQDALRGDQLERRYRERAYAYLGRILRGAQAVSLRELETTLEEHLSADELDELLPLDVLVRGRAGRVPDAPEVWLAMEVSAVVDRNDVEWARRRAALLRKAGYRVVPTAAGEEVTEGGAEAARAGRVLLLQDGRRQFWEEALADALSN